MILVLLVAGLTLQGEIARLGDPRPAVRREACRILLAAGDRAVPALMRALGDLDVEVRRGVMRILDHHVQRVRGGKRRCSRYVIPDNRQTRTLSGTRGARLQAVFLSRDHLMRSYSQHYRGVLTGWSSPTLADYLGLLDALSEHVHGTVSPGPDRGLLEHIFAVDSLVWRLRTLTAPTHWTVRWIARRRLLSDVEQCLIVRGKNLSIAEARAYRSLLGVLSPLCDAAADARCRLLLKRLTRP